jgi:hypothetical protein
MQRFAEEGGNVQIPHTFASLAIPDGTKTMTQYTHFKVASQ